MQGDIVAYNVEDAPPPPPVARINLFNRLREQQEPKTAQPPVTSVASKLTDVKPPLVSPAMAAAAAEAPNPIPPAPDPPAPQPIQSKAEPAQEDEAATTFPPTDGSRSWVRLVVPVLLAVAIAGAISFFLYRQTHPKQAAVTAAPTPSPKFSPTPRLKPTASPAIKPKPAAPGKPGSYTVLSGDTLITVAEKFGKDWHAISAANGGISDPNLIYPGQVLTIP
jgi:nucleoid-associated protein YgaU